MIERGLPAWRSRLTTPAAGTASGAPRSSIPIAARERPLPSLCVTEQLFMVVCSYVNSCFPNQPWSRRLSTCRQGTLNVQHCGHPHVCMCNYANTWKCEGPIDADLRRQERNT